jgi:predicted ATPase/class 3 adenylate cyclase
MAELPTGTVTLLFTDIEGSTKLLEELGRQRYAEALSRHRDLLRGAFSEREGYEVDHEGDAFFVAFASAAAAVGAAAAAQRALASENWPEGRAVQVRMGVHTGEPLLVPPKYVGLDVHRAARIMAAGHGGQVLVSERTAGLVEEAPEAFSLRDLGEHRLKDLSGAQRLYQLVIEGAESEFPPLRTLGNRATNLPVQPNRLVGRTEELASVTALLLKPETHLLTLTGPGGTGKTRVALQAAAELVDEFADGVFVVFLGSIRDPDLIFALIAQALGLRQRADKTPAELLADYLQQREVLLVLDNLEHLLEGAAATVALMAGLPRVTVLATSREPLNVSAERVFEIPPLATPEADPATAAEALKHDSVVLFVERATATHASFELTDNDAAAVADVCTRLDGLPLAIELAAARIRALSPQALQRRLGERLALLTGGTRDAEERQRTLRATIEWSYELLAESERTLFVRLAVFVGGCRQDAAGAVFDLDESSTELLDGLSSLVQKSLLRRRDDPDGEPRFWMLETIREYARDRLDATGDSEVLGRAHAEYFLRLAEQGDREVRGREQVAWLDRLESEHDNIRGALRWSLACAPELALRLTGALSLFWEIKGHWNEGIRWAKDALAVGKGSEPGEYAKGLFGAGFLAPLESNYAEGIALGDLRRQAHTSNELAWLHLSLGDNERARELGEIARTLLIEVDDKWLSAQASMLLGATFTDVPETSSSAFEDSLAHGESLNLEALALLQEVGDEIHAARVRANLGWVALLREDYVQARSLLEQSRSVATQIGDDYLVWNSLGNLGLVSLFEGKTDQAAECACLTLERFLEPGDKRAAVEALCTLAGVAALTGSTSQAGRLWGAAEALRQSIQLVPSSPELRIYDRYVLEARAEAQQEFDAARDEGQAMTASEAVVYALAESFDLAKGPEIRVARPSRKSPTS